MRTDKYAVKMNTDTALYVIVGIIGVVILFQVVAALFPTLTAAGDTLNTSGFPLGELFVTGGAIWYVFAAVIIVVVIKLLSDKMSK